MKKITFFFLFSFLLFSCVPAAQTSSPTVTVYATSAAEPWLHKLFACANDISVVLNINADSPEIYLRLGEPEMIVSPVYQIGEEEILVVTQPKNAVQNLTLAEAQILFAQGDPFVQVWVYASDADVQLAFEQLVMKERRVTSSANAAVSPQEMFNVLMSESNTLGILPRQWMTGNLREVYSAGTVPILAITKSEPQGVLIDLISCLQNN